ncbi:MAG: pyridoxamine 5'-phosphate oxidase family protein [Candidatus Methanoperedens sp.]|nr:pyridoxamine 5'-phosphate oxidase family protein [Candidatus Methanoperedens sp.]
MTEEIVKIPKMDQPEYDRLIREQYVARIAFPGEKYPYIAPFIYFFDGNHMYFLSTKYGKKIENFMKNPFVSVEVEKYSPDMSNYAFITLSGRIVEVIDLENKKEIRDSFIRMIKDRDLSNNVMIAFGHSSQDPPEALIREERNIIWKLTDVRKITGLKQ